MRHNDKNTTTTHEAITLKIITINLNEHQVKALGVLQELGLYPSRSEAIRVAIRDFLARRFVTITADQVPGPITVTEQDVEDTKREINKLLRKLREELPEESKESLNQVEALQQ